MKDGFKKCLKMYQTPFQADDKKSKSTTTASTYFQTFTPVLTISEDFLDISESFLILASMFISRSRSSCRIWNVIFHVAGVKLGFPRVKIDFFIVTSSNSWSSLRGVRISLSIFDSEKYHRWKFSLSIDFFYCQWKFSLSAGNFYCQW